MTTNKLKACSQEQYKTFTKRMLSAGWRYENGSFESESCLVLFSKYHDDILLQASVAHGARRYAYNPDYFSIAE